LYFNGKIEDTSEKKASTSLKLSTKKNRNYIDGTLKRKWRRMIEFHCTGKRTLSFKN